MKKIIFIILISIIIFFIYFNINFKINKNLITIDINELLTNTENYKKYYKKNVKVTGKISKIEGTSYLYLQAYFANNELNGHVKFDENSYLKVDISGFDISDYKIYDYITIIGFIEEYEKKTNTFLLTNITIENNNIYNNYTYEVILKDECDNTLIKYIDNFYFTCIKNIYINYKVDKYELSYALKDKKITFDELIKNSKVISEKNIIIYKLEKFNILTCDNTKNIILDKNSEIDYELCLKK